MFVVLPGACKSCILYVLHTVTGWQKVTCGLQIWMDSFSWPGDVRCVARSVPVQHASCLLSLGIPSLTKRKVCITEHDPASEIWEVGQAGRLGRWAVLEASQTRDVELSERDIRNTWTYWRQSPLWQTLLVVLNVSLQRIREAMGRFQCRSLWVHGACLCFRVWRPAGAGHRGLVWQPLLLLHRLCQTVRTHIRFVSNLVCYAQSTITVISGWHIRLDHVKNNMGMSLSSWFCSSWSCFLVFH